MTNKIIRSKRLYENQLSYGDITSVSGAFEFDDGSEDNITNASKDDVYGKLIQAIFQASNTNNMLIIRDEDIGKNFITSLYYIDDEIRGTGYCIVKQSNDNLIRLVNFTYKKNSDEFEFAGSTNALLTDEQFFTFKQIEKFKFFSGNYDFEEQELLENVSQDVIYGPIIEAFKESIRTNNDIGVILYDGPTSQNTFIGYITREIAYLYTINYTSISIINLEYDNQRDTLTVTNTTEDVLVEDNVKTLFGNQSLVGKGNIDLYNHQILVNNDCYFNIPSSNNLPIDSPQDLTTVLKPTTKNIYYFGFQKSTLNTASLEYDKATNLWKYRASNADDLTAVTTVKDVCTTI